MSAPGVNLLKQKLDGPRAQFGLFCCLPAFQTVEALAASGFDFFILDAEHAPTSLPLMHAQLAALAASTTVPVVRLPANEPVLVKQLLDLGVQVLMVPNVQSAEDAVRAVRHTRYPPHGVRGIGGSVRATAYGRNAASYYQGADSGIALLAQVESRAGLENLEAIARVEGVDAVFFGPNDLAADLGRLGEPAHPEVESALLRGIEDVRRAGKAAGVLAGEAHCERYLRAGANLVALASEVGLLVRAADALAQRASVLSKELIPDAAAIAARAPAMVRPR